MTQIYNWISFIAFCIAGICMIMSIILFFKFNIYSIINFNIRKNKSRTVKVKRRISMADSNFGDIKETALLDEGSGCVKLMLRQNVIIVHTDEIIS